MFLRCFPVSLWQLIKIQEIIPDSAADDDDEVVGDGDSGGANKLGSELGKRDVNDRLV